MLRILELVASSEATPTAWLPGLRMWVGEYPFLLRPAFEELCQLRLNSRR